MSSRSTLERARVAHESGRLAQAQSLYQRVLAAEPGHADALHCLGLLAHGQGEGARAADLIRRSIAVRPDCATFQLSLGNVLEATGDLSGALEAYLEAARLEPDAADAQFNAGLTRLKLSRPVEAEKSFTAAAALDPDDAAAYLNLGHALRDQARWEEARAAYARALELKPTWVPALNALGYALRTLGCDREAAEAYRRSLERRPHDAVAHNNLGNALRDLGQVFAARRCYERAVELDSGIAQVHLNLALARRETREIEAALRSCQRALELEPAIARGRSTLASILRHLSPRRHERWLERELILCFRSPEIDAQELARVAAGQVRYKHRLGGRLDADRALLPTLAGDELLIELLGSAINVDPDLEPVLARLRRELLLGTSELDVEPASGDALMAALALQCFANEFVFAVTPPERVHVAGLQRELGALTREAIEPSRPALRGALLKLAMYCPLWTLDSLRALREIPAARWGPELGAVVSRALCEPLEERELQTAFSSLGEIRDGVSKRVAQQYEQSPYPRWVRIGTPERTSLGVSLRRRFPHLRASPGLGAGTKALIVGCGTGYEPIQLALREPQWEIIALDLSRASLAYGRRRAGELGISNLEFLHADVLDLPRLESRFELVSASGVLHHMREPVVGWQRVTDRLAAGGLMRVGLYSRLARRAIAVARQCIESEALAPSADDIRRFRRRLLDRELSPDLSALERSLDLYSISTCRDLLFHVEEHHFDLLEIDDCLERLGLDFVGFEHAEPGVDELYRRMFPRDTERTHLANWARYEAAHPDTFVGMYQFWCQKR